MVVEVPLQPELVAGDSIARRDPVFRTDRGRTVTDPGHPKTIRLREDALLDAISRFFADRVLGPHRREILAADLGTVDDRAQQQRGAERERLQRIVADLTRRQESVLRQAQDGDSDDPFTKGLRTTYNEIETQKNTALAAISDLNANDDKTPASINATMSCSVKRRQKSPAVVGSGINSAPSAFIYATS